MKTVQGLVSIVIPVFNAVPYLEECLASAAGQTYQPLEIIVINDGSTDSSEELINKFASYDNRFKTFNQKNQGLGYTRNRGISLSAGQYIFFLDADDVLPKNSIALLAAVIRKINADYSVGKVLRFNENRMYVPIRHLEFDLYKKPGLTTLLNNPELLQDSIACNKLWRTDFLKGNSLCFKEGKYYEDLALTMKAAVLAEKIAVIDEVVYHWRVRDAEDKPSITQQQMKLENTLHRLEALAENRQWLINRHIDKRIIEEHDLKSLLDVMRLHAVKFALIDPAEKEEWKQQTSSFLRTIPTETALKLPDKERAMYGLLLEGNTGDLFLFSQMLMDTEEQPIVTQEQDRFVLKGFRQEIEVTPFLKPEMIVEHIEKMEAKWRLEGKLRIPKASYPVNGTFYLIDRKSGQEKILTPLQLSQAETSSCYPFEEQVFTAVIDSKQFEKEHQEAAYDFYYRLGAFPKSPPARVRALPKAFKTTEAFKKGNYTLSLYRNNYGNLSMQIHKKSVKDYVKKALAPLWKK
ncbi:glycosyltransferase family 2 protein [Planococcus shenhongbingii]|uniref:Glycosyltransferase family 2 protein n=1 Tax=Planococcus shenhongbingii TaxID=3058398 RepID=A0ABT8N9J4_9BACL|nr:glycosyltransferase family 2 protein [Planococcus sp. N017]MDN7244559.1 glycosyltransferase family 2 protein [Planococcus sp. N017]